MPKPKVGHKSTTTPAKRRAGAGWRVALHGPPSPDSARPTNRRARQEHAHSGGPRTTSLTVADPNDRKEEEEEKKEKEEEEEEGGERWKGRRGGGEGGKEGASATAQNDGAEELCGRRPPTTPRVPKCFGS